MKHIAAGQARLRKIYEARADKVAFLKGDPDVDFEYVAQVVDITHRAGAERVGLMAPRQQNYRLPCWGIPRGIELAGGTCMSEGTALIAMIVIVIVGLAFRILLLGTGAARYGFLLRKWQRWFLGGSSKTAGQK